MKKNESEGTSAKKRALRRFGEFKLAKRGKEGEKLDIWERCKIYQLYTANFKTGANELGKETTAPILSAKSVTSLKGWGRWRNTDEKVHDGLVIREIVCTFSPDDNEFTLVYTVA